MFDLKEYIEILDENQLNELLLQLDCFHDGIIREFHMVNNSYIEANLSMYCNFTYDARMLIQRQWENPSAVELIFRNIQSIKMKNDALYDSIISGATFDLLIDSENENKTIVMNFGDIKISSSELYYKDASEWMGKKIRY